MSTVAAKLEFRCSFCYQSVLATEDQVGESVECGWCQAQNRVPDATEDRLQRGAESSSEGIVIDGEVVSRAEVSRLAVERAQRLTEDDKVCRRPELMGASRGLRLFAAAVDTILFVVVCSIAWLLLSAAMGLESRQLADKLLASGDDPLRVFATLEPATLLRCLWLPIAWIVFQWAYVTRRGQTVGKRLFGIKIVDGDGYPPGFFRGVVLRNGSQVLLTCSGVYGVNSVPLLGDFVFAVVTMTSLGNYGWVLAAPSRCWHDYIAGTYVIDA